MLPPVPASQRHNITKWRVTKWQGEAVESLIISWWGSYCVAAAERGKKREGAREREREVVTLDPFAF